jgi:hypothetical protein
VYRRLRMSLHELEHACHFARHPPGDVRVLGPGY